MDELEKGDGPGRVRSGQISWVEEALRRTESEDPLVVLLDLAELTQALHQRAVVEAKRLGKPAPPFHWYESTGIHRLALWEAGLIR